MNLKPLGDRVVVQPKEEDEARTASGLVIPDTAKEKPQLSAGFAKISGVEGKNMLRFGQGFHHVVEIVRQFHAAGFTTGYPELVVAFPIGCMEFFKFFRHKFLSKPIHIITH